MAFVARTTRENNKLGQTYVTPSHVGPGSYDAQPKKWGARPSYAPFSSTSTRSSDVGAKKDYTPGPGAYEQASATLGIIGNSGSQSTKAKSSAFKSKTTRFGSAKNHETPGPGAYTRKEQWVKKGNGRIGRPPENPAIQWVRMPTAPSIPGQGDQYGYEESNEGELLKQPAPFKGHTGRGADTTGPGEYSPNQERWVKKGNKGASWGKSRTTRTNFAQQSAPGPGHYKTDRKTRGGRKRQSATFQSRTQRGKALVAGGGEAAPGPGTYAAKSAFGKATTKAPENLQFFGSTSKRFTAHNKKASGSIGPGAYRTNTSAFDRKKQVRRHPTAGNIGFSSTSSRTILGAGRQNAPGPASYSPKGFADEILKKEERKGAASFEMPFGSSTRRFGSSGEQKAPGPGSYEQNSFESLQTKRGKAKASSSFASSSKRFVKKKALQTPDPGTYDVTKQWSVGKRETGLLAFGPDRFKTDPSKFTPGPGAYKTPGNVADRIAKNNANRKNVMVSEAVRFKYKSRDDPGQIPGPGQYDTEYLYGNMNKRTFNMTIAEEMYN